MSSEVNMSSIQEFITTITKLGEYSNGNSLKIYLQQFFGKHSVKNLRILDIGGGAGLLSFWVAFNDGLAVCLEPESGGSSHGIRKSFNKISLALNICSERAHQLSTTFQEFSDNNRFDMILLANSINHLNEEATIRLQEDIGAFKEYLSYFRKMHSLLSSRGSVSNVVTGNANVFNIQQLDAAGANGHVLAMMTTGDYNSITTHQQGTNDKTVNIQTQGSNNTITVRTSSSTIVSPATAIAR